MEKVLTIYTPTYNRKHLLPRLYESLKCQTNKSFIWLVIDDGSNDSTEDLIKGYIEEAAISIEYHYKENGGVHTAKNEACRFINTELMVFAPSDCILVKDAVEIILTNWENKKKDDSIGIVFHYEDIETGRRIGGLFPEGVRVNGIGSGSSYRIKEDKVFVYKSDIYKRSIYPVYEGEKLFPDSWKFYMMYDAGYFELSNQIVIQVEYTDDGYTRNLLKTMANSPKGYFEYNRTRLQHEDDLGLLARATIHYIAFAILSGEKGAFFKTKRKLLYTLLYPLGVIWAYRLKRIQSDKASAFAAKVLEIYKKHI